MRIPSPEETSSWFPDLAVDREGRVHVVWCETDIAGVQKLDPGSGYIGEYLYYSMWDGQRWSRFNDIVPPHKHDIIRNAIAIDGYDVLHLLFDHPPGKDLYYAQARAGEAFSATAWTFPRLMNGKSRTYMNDIATYQDELHIVYDDAGAEDGECPGCGDIYYRRSTDRGLTWSAPVALFPTGTGSGRAQIEVDRTGTIHVAWDEGWDRHNNYFNPGHGVYMCSTDGGSIWSAPTIVSYPAATNVQLAVGSNGQGGVILVWRTTLPEYPGIYYMGSTDQGASWSPPQALPGIVARPWNGPFDVYDMATDSVGHIHLLVVGRLPTEETQELSGLYHFEWDGDGWSPPLPVYKGSWYPEYPHLVIDRGNQLHATWFIREHPWEVTVPHQVWYAHGQSQAPAETPVPPPTSTPTPTPTPLATATPTATPYPTLAPGGTALPDGLYTESDDLLRLLVGLAPVLILATAVLAIRFGWLRRSSGR